MHDDKNKYSLWLVPKGDAGKTLQTLITKLAAAHQAPTFVPHMTLVANIFADAAELEAVKGQVRACANALESFTVRLTEYGYLDEEFRCLYLMAQSAALPAVYAQAAGMFPQIHSEHFQAMPHLSVLYGNYPASTKQAIIAENPLPTLTFTVDALDLYLTNSPTENWQLAQSFPLRSSDL